MDHPALLDLHSGGDWPKLYVLYLKSRDDILLLLLENHS